MKLSFERKERKEIFDLFPIFLGEGCFKRVYTNEEGTLVLKVPKEEEGDYEEVGGSEYEVDYEFCADSYNGYFDCDPEFIFEAPFPELILRTSRLDNSKNFVVNRENPVNFCGLTENICAFLREIENYLNVSSEARKVLAPIVEVGFFSNNCPFLIAQRIGEVYGNSYEESLSDKKIVHSVTYNPDYGGYSLEAFINVKEDPISDMGRYLSYSQEEIDLTKYRFLKAMSELGLSFCEQVNNWQNLGCDIGTKKIYMIDYA